MTPKEKAIELIEQFEQFSDYKECDVFTQRERMFMNAKQCALICVEEILNESPSKRYWDTYDDETPSAITFWQEVKEEIEKL